jgi:hypothetical protein
MAEWIDVNDRLPTNSDVVLIVRGSETWIGFLQNTRIWWDLIDDAEVDEDDDRPVTHWMPLPSPPVRKEK